MVHYKNAVLYFDGACKSNPHGAGGCGFVLKRVDEDNKRILHKIVEGYFFLGHVDIANNVADYNGLVKALEFMIINGITVSHLQVRGQSAIVIKQLNGTNRVRSPLMIPLYHRATSLLNNGDNIEDFLCRIVSKMENFRANSLADISIKKQSDWSSPL